MTGKRGFTLLEMIVATTVMGIAVVGLLSGIAGATRNAARLREYERVVQLARMQMDFLLADRTVSGSRSGRFEPQQTGGLEAGWQSRISASQTPPNPAAGQPVLDRIELEIWWMQGEQRRTFTLDAFRTRFLSGSDAGTP
ncbi:MAG: type II secretion system protein [Bryobacteraceae bacterium]|jgi:general secretion pathway protein I